MSIDSAAERLRATWDQQPPNEYMDGLLNEALAEAATPSPALDVSALAMVLHSFLPVDPGQWKVWVPDHFGGGSDQYINSSEFAARILARLSESES